MRHFYGKITMYPSYNRNARNWVLNFLEHYFPDQEKLMYPIVNATVPGLPDLDGHFPIDRTDFSTAFKKGLRTLGKYTAEYGESVPPLIKQYMVLSPKMKTFGTFVNADFGDVEETGILISVDTIYEEKRAGYIIP